MKFRNFIMITGLVWLSLLLIFWATVKLGYNGFLAAIIPTVAITYQAVKYIKSK